MELKKITFLKRATTLSARELKRGEKKFAEEYYWAMTRAAVGLATADQVTVYRILDSTGLSCVYECGWSVCTHFRLAQDPTYTGPSGTVSGEVSVIEST
jgi:hypothetical protein